ncbi:MAG: 16S rRNA (guanine(966)-N(2))-methyltransferase RsmD [Selenomonadaceae bacterium]|nr:16S rRNA (guanine(966)-N(2))-methyltransferase RsmD [Selenomonadaceae bacterium]
MRIITGTAKGLKLKSPKDFLTRPTSDRVKESLFSILNGMKNFSEIENVLDIFAGTGALGIESLSRGAKKAFFIDSATSEIISENVKRAKFENVCRIYRGDFVKALKKISAENLKFDLIFSDPPYRKNFAQISAEIVSEQKILKADGIFVMEHGFDEKIIPPENLELIRKIDYGKTTEIEIFGLKGEF